MWRFKVLTIASPTVWTCLNASVNSLRVTASRRLESSQFFQEVLREFREDSIRREAAMPKAFKDAFKQVHTVGLAIVKTLNRHTQILERIDRRLAAPGNGRRGRDDGRGR